MAIEQRIFDWVVAHLTHQAYPSLGPMGDCAYRGDNNTACSIGCLIDDHTYNGSLYELEGESCKSINVTNAVAKTIGVIDPPHDLLLSLQRAHDHVTVYDPPNFHTWRRRLLNNLRIIADRFQLKTTQLDYMEQRFNALSEQPQNTGAV